MDKDEPKLELDEEDMTRYKEVQKMQTPARNTSKKFFKRTPPGIRVYSIRRWRNRTIAESM
jgi:hypothetical protein